MTLYGKIVSKTCDSRGIILGSKYVVYLFSRKIIFFTYYGNGFYVFIFISLFIKKKVHTQRKDNSFRFLCYFNRRITFSTDAFFLNREELFQVLIHVLLHACIYLELCSFYIEL